MLVWSRKWDNGIPRKWSPQSADFSCCVVIRFHSSIGEISQNLSYVHHPNLDDDYFSHVIQVFTRILSWKLHGDESFIRLFCMLCRLFVILPLHVYTAVNQAISVWPFKIHFYVWNCHKFLDVRKEHCQRSSNLTTLNVQLPNNWVTLTMMEYVPYWSTLSMKWIWLSQVEFSFIAITFTLPHNAVKSVKRRDKNQKVLNYLQNFKNIENNSRSKPSSSAEHSFYVHIFSYLQSYPRKCSSRTFLHNSFPLITSPWHGTIIWGSHASILFTAISYFSLLSLPFDPTISFL